MTDITIQVTELAPVIEVTELAPLISVSAIAGPTIVLGDVDLGLTDLLAVDVSTNATALANQHLRVNASGGARTIGGPTANGALWAVSKVDSSANPVTVTLGGGATTTIYQIAHGRIMLVNGTTADVLSDRKPFGYADFLDENIQSGTAYTAVFTDIGKVITMTNASANAVTIPPVASVAWPVGTQLLVAEAGAGQTTITPGSGVTFRAPDGAKISAQYGQARMWHRATNEWWISGKVTT